MPKGYRIIEPKFNLYYAGPSGIGPRFGATRENAHVFKTYNEAYGATAHYAFVGCKIEDPEGKVVAE
jgi:hypothetical protein